MRHTFLVGDEHEDWTVLRTLRDSYGKQKVLCCCVCGTVTWVRRDHLLHSTSTQCMRCRSRVTCAARMELPNMPRRLYNRLMRAACAAIYRCTRGPSHPQWDSYGGRGIEVRFADYVEFTAYLATLEGCEDESLVLDRIDNDGHYERGNLRFATRSVSQYNRSTNWRYRK